MLALVLSGLPIFVASLNVLLVEFPPKLLPERHIVLGVANWFRMLILTSSHEEKDSRMSSGREILLLISKRPIQRQWWQSNRRT